MATPSQDETLQAFREILSSEDILHEGDTIGSEDETLLLDPLISSFYKCFVNSCPGRFLRARKFDMLQSKKMFIDCQNWRKTVEGIGIDELYKQIDPFDYPERAAVFDCWPMWFHKTDKQGRPINVHVFGKMDLNKLYKSCTPEKHWQTVLVNAESLPREVLPAATRAAGKSITTTLCIIDLKGFGLQQFWQMKSLVRMSFQISQDYYPETMGQLAVINAPSSFTIIWNIVKPWLSKETASKVDILGSDYQSVLLSMVDAENLPSFLGGVCNCEDDGGCHLSSVGPWLDGRTGWGPKAQAAKEAKEGE